MPPLPDYFRFASPGWLWLLVLLPVLALLRARAGRLSAVKFSAVPLLRGLGSPVRKAMGGFLVGLTLLGLGCGIVAIAQPQQLRTQETIEESGVEIFLSLDLSLSMSIRDMSIGGQKVDRLTVAKKVVRDFVRNRTSDRVGFVVFSGRPYLASPLTLDQEWLMATLERIGFNQTKDMGTAIGSSLATAAKRLTNRTTKSKIIILLTDGANNSGKISPKDAAKLAATLGIKIYAVGLGTPGYHQVPVPTPDGQYVGVRDEFDEESLKAVASITGGRFYPARDAEALAKIFAEIDRLEKTKLNVRRHTEIDELYHWPLAAASICLVLAIILGQTLLRRNPA